MVIGFISYVLWLIKTVASAASGYKKSLAHWNLCCIWIRLM